MHACAAQVMAQEARLADARQAAAAAAAGGAEAAARREHAAALAQAQAAEAAAASERLHAELAQQRARAEVTWLWPLHPRIPNMDLPHSACISAPMPSTFAAVKSAHCLVRSHATSGNSSQASIVLPRAHA